MICSLILFDFIVIYMQAMKQENRSLKGFSLERCLPDGIGKRKEIVFSHVQKNKKIKIKK